MSAAMVHSTYWEAVAPAINYHGSTADLPSNRPDPRTVLRVVPVPPDLNSPSPLRMVEPDFLGAIVRAARPYLSPIQLVVAVDLSVQFHPMVEFAVK